MTRLEWILLRHGWTAQQLGLREDDSIADSAEPQVIAPPKVVADDYNGEAPAARARASR